MQDPCHSSNRIENNMGLVHSIAWKYHCSTGIDLVDLTAEGYWALCYADSKYDDSRGVAKFSSFAYTVVQSRIINLVNMHNRIGTYEVALWDEEHQAEHDVPDPNPMDIESRIYFMERLDSLSQLAQRVCHLVIHGFESGGFARRYDSKKSIKSRLKREGYQKREILSAFTEVTEVFG